MCTNGRFLTNKYTGKQFFCKCGKCPACLQEKALIRTNRLRSEISSDWSNLFVTLTYDRMTCPFIFQKDVDDHRPFLNIYREFDVRWDVNRNRHIRYRNLDSDGNFIPVDSIKIFDGNDDSVASTYYYGSTNMKYLKHQYGKVGVCYYPDLQDFIKRLRINLNRYYGKNIPLRFWSCSEYGSKSKRPHFHIIIMYKEAAYIDVRDSIIKSWSYGDNIRRDKSIQFVKFDASAYVSSYVNCVSSLPPFIKKFFPPKYSCSKHFGHHFSGFDFSSVLDKVRKGDLSVNVQTNNKGLRDYVSIQIPKYVVNRFFPIFKGYSRFTDSQICDILRCCGNESNVRAKLRFYQSQYDSINYKKPICFYGDDTHKIAVRLNNAYQYYKEKTGLTAYDYAFDFTQAWRVFRSNQYRKLLEDTNVPVLQKYDNYKDFYLRNDKSRYFEIIHSLAPRFVGLVCIDPNLFPTNISRTAKMTHIFYSYDKQKKVSHHVLFEQGVNV